MLMAVNCALWANPFTHVPSLRLSGCSVVLSVIRGQPSHAGIDVSEHSRSHDSILLFVPSAPPARWPWPGFRRPSCFPLRLPSVCCFGGLSGQRCSVVCAGRRSPWRAATAALSNLRGERWDYALGESIFVAPFLLFRLSPR